VLSAKAAKAAIAAGVKPTALVTRIETRAATPHTTVVPTLSQKTRKDGAPAVLPAAGKNQVTSASKGSAKKDSAKVSRWHKRWTPKKQASAATHQPAAGGKAQVASSAQKPSPAIKKGPQNQ